MSTTANSAGARGLSKNERFVILASSTGTVFEWYDFYLYATLAPFFAALFFPPDNPTWGLLGALAAYAAGFLVRPFGALFFGRIGDLFGRKYTFLVTIIVMGLSTFLVGLLPTYASIGGLAPLLLVLIRLIQGLALGGEYGGAATYVAEHAQNGRRGYATSWIQTTATIGFFLSLLVIGALRKYMDPAVFKDWGWRVPFLASAVLLVFSVWIRLKLDESPIFQKMKNEGTRSLSPIRDSFFKAPNNKYVLLAILGATMGQGVVWYTAQFYALFFVGGPLKANWNDQYWIVAIAVLAGTPFFVIFGQLSDRIGRLKIIMAGCILAVLTYFPLFHLLAKEVNPDLATFNDTAKITVTADPAQCHFTIFPIAGWTTQGDCDKGKSLLTSNGISFVSANGAAGSKATLDINGTKVEGFSGFGWAKALADAGYPHMKAAPSQVILTKDQTEAVVAAQTAKKPADAEKVLNEARKAVDAASKPLAAMNMVEAPVVDTDGNSTVNVTEIKTSFADPAKMNYWGAIGIVWIMMIYVAMVYGPIAAFLVEMFPSNVRYTSMSFPYHIGNGWFGGLLPLFATAYVAYTGNVFAGLWYPVIFAAICVFFGIFFLKDTKDVDIAKT
ncbi:MFS transporter [Aestuariivirga litoralis]|uniref:MFS transporter n=1 Tax=Aestuariivirga litoralis TaxID=2650924 RepID=UPI0018C58E0E|nr:MFS transporter [Aestuariivirga litoralis]MBG1232566.1 MHS family MFS transporter [Aestuariivirga litoralis]